MNKIWWKLVGVLLILFTLIGGLWLPLKTGITDVKNAQLESGKTQIFQIHFYNITQDFQPEKVYLKLADEKFYACEKLEFNSGTGTCAATINAILPAKTKGIQSLDLFVYAQKKWMALPASVNIRLIDTSNQNSKPNYTNISNLENDKTFMSGLPNRPILFETIRNLFYHVPMWFAMIFLLFVSAWYSVKYLLNPQTDANLKASSFATVAMLFGILGCTTGMTWARVTWGDWWPRDPKLNGVAIGMLLYAAYFVLRAGIQDPFQKARISAIYNVFIYPIFIALIIIMPKLNNLSLHPGSGGSVGFNQYDLDSTMRVFFYPAVIGWILTATWIATLRYRLAKLQQEKLQHDE